MLAHAQVTAAEQVYQTDITTSSSQEKHYHPKRLLITLNEHPTEEQAQKSAILPEVGCIWPPPPLESAQFFHGQLAVTDTLE